jgi:hypothetical protein
MSCHLPLHIKKEEASFSQSRFNLMLFPLPLFSFTPCQAKRGNKRAYIAALDTNLGMNLRDAGIGPPRKKEETLRGLSVLLSV